MQSAKCVIGGSLRRHGHENGSGKREGEGGGEGGGCGAERGSTHTLTMVIVLGGTRGCAVTSGGAWRRGRRGGNCVGRRRGRRARDRLGLPPLEIAYSQGCGGEDRRGGPRAEGYHQNRGGVQAPLALAWEADQGCLGAGKRQQGGEFE